jgi:activator of HSP90 ATPase
MTTSFTVSTLLPVSAERIYKAWLNSAEHAAFTGSAAKIDPTIGGTFSAWDGYISGKNTLLEPYRRIIQSWRTTEFPEQAPDSRLEILLKAVPEGTRITLKHSQIPEGQAEEYKRGWKEFYFAPMRAYFLK